MEPEVWVPVAGYAGRYEVSNMGAVRNVSGRQASLMKLATTPHGHRVVKLYLNGFGTTFRVHQLVWRGFKHESVCVKHIDGNLSNNKLSNLGVRK